jgi:hypothetical protein
MIEITEAPQTPILPAQDFPEPVVVPHPSSTEEETVLAGEITALWLQHEDFRSALRNSKAETSKLREELGQRLTQMKEVLARPGRNGEWSSWLKQQQIPRATADRLVARHATSLNRDMNCLSESIIKPTEEEILKFVSATSSRVRKTLPGAINIYHFIGFISLLCGLESNETAEGILIPRPESAAPERAAVSAEIVNAGIGLPQSFSPASPASAPSPFVPPSHSDPSTAPAWSFSLALHPQFARLR